MNRFRYVAYDREGQRISQVVAATSMDDIRNHLWSQGMHIVDIRRPLFQLPALHEAFPTFIRVRRSEVILFTKQLATFVRVGVPMLDGLSVLQAQASSGGMRAALTDVVADLRAGSPLSAAFARHPAIFSALYIDMVRSAEVSGNLDEVLRQLAVYMSRDESALRKVRNAMIYPAIVIGLALAVIAVLIGFVLPAFARLFADYRAAMPLPTQILLTTGTFCRDHSIQLIVIVLLLTVAIGLYARTKRGHETWDVVVLRMPQLGTIMRFAIVERYLRTLATLARAGVPISQMIDTASRALGNSVFEKGLADVRQDMLSGLGFSGPLSKSRLFPALVIQMIKVGEETGSLDTNLEEAAEHYAEEVDYRLKQMITLLEPALVIVVGVMVGFIAISVIAPMYSLVHAIH
ncbi:MAG TPA: type II secretion system F family protein [Candidatus Dormibacteraeota bacterium]